MTFQANKALGYTQLAAGTLATAQALSPPAGACRALIICEAQAVRWRDDGTAPTATIGMPLPTNTPLLLEVAQMAQVQFIEVVAGAILNITYWG